jgi:hypothetical protein
MGACRRKALLTRPGFNEAAGDWTLRPCAGDPGLARTPAGVSLSSQVCVALLALRGLQSRVSDSAMIDKPEPRRFPPPWDGLGADSEEKHEPKHQHRATYQYLISNQISRDGFTLTGYDR